MPLPPPPRRVRSRLGAFAFVWLFRLFSIWIIVLAVALVGLSLGDPAARAVGTERAAVVTRVHHSPKDRTGHRYTVDVSYDPGNGDRIADDDTVDTGGGPPPAVGSTVAVMTLPVGVLHRAVLRDQPSPRGLICLGLFTLMWCVGTVGMVVAAWVYPVLEARRVRTGIAVAGVVTDKRTVPRSRGVRTEVTYAYEPHAAVAPSETVLVSTAAYRRLAVGQRVTVLLPAAGDGRPLLYEASAYRVLAAPRREPDQSPAQVCRPDGRGW